MKLPRMSELADTSVLGFPLGLIIVDILQGLGIEDGDLPNIIPEFPTGLSDEDMTAWMKINLPAVYAKVEALEVAS